MAQKGRYKSFATKQFRILIPKYDQSNATLVLVKEQEHNV